jgi:hypothetical protein
MSLCRVCSQNIDPKKSDYCPNGHAQPIDDRKTRKSPPSPNPVPALKEPKPEP